MNVAMVIPSFYPKHGGAESQLRLLINQLLIRNFQPTVYTKYIHGSPIYEILDGVKIDRHSGSILYFPYFIALFFSLFRNRHSINIVHCHSLSLSTALPCCLFSFLFSKPLIFKVTRSGPNTQLSILNSSFLYRIIWKIIVFQCSSFIALTHHSLSELLSYNVPLNKITLIPNGVNLSPFLLNSFTSPVHITMCSRLIARKNVAIALHAFSLVDQSHKSILHIIGSGPEFEVLENLSYQLGIADNVVFHGPLDSFHVQKLLAASHIFVISSSSEGLSNSLLEAMSLSNAIIASDIPPHREVLADLNSALFFKDYMQLSSHLNLLIQNQEKRFALTKSSYNLTLNFYGLDLITDKYISLYNRFQ